MILLDYLRDNELAISKKGQTIIAKAVKDVFPNLDVRFQDETELVFQVLYMDISEEDCLKILEAAARYASLWAFA